MQPALLPGLSASHASLDPAPKPVPPPSVAAAARQRSVAQGGKLAATAYGQASSDNYGNSNIGQANGTATANGGGVAYDVAVANTYNTAPWVPMDYNNRRASATSHATNQNGGDWCAPLRAVGVELGERGPRSQPQPRGQPSSSWPTAAERPAAAEPQLLAAAPALSTLAPARTPRRAFALGGAFTNADVGTAEALADSLAENNGQNNNTAAAFTVGPSGENNLAISNTTAVDNNVVSGTALALSSGADIGFVLDVADQAYPNGIPEDAAQAAYLTNNFNALLGQTQKSTADGTIFPLPLPYPVGSPPPPSGSAPPP